jgi:hypothetical protein
MSFAFRQFELRSKNRDAWTPSKGVGNLDAISVAQGMWPPLTRPDKAATPEGQSEAGKLRTHPTNLLRRGELYPFMSNARTCHG